MNGVCGTTRLLGCYHLGPEVIPAPTLTSLTLSPGDDYIILGTESLWRHVTQDLAVCVVYNEQTPSSAARRLRDLAVARGAKTDISIIVIRLAPPTRGVELDEWSESHSKDLAAQLDSERDQSKEDVEFTNIDDLLSDSEENMEQGQEPVWNGVRLREKGEPLAPVGQAEYDQMILDTVTSPPSSPFTPEMKSTNIDDILTPSHPHTLPPSHPGSPAYPAQTIPRDAAGSRSKGGEMTLPLPPSQAIDYEQFRDSFEVTQSAPSIPGDQRLPPETTPTVGGAANRRGSGVVERQMMVEEAGFGGSLQRDRDEGGRKRGRRRDTRERGLRGDLARQEIKGGMAGTTAGDMEGYLAQLNQVMTDLDSNLALRNGMEPGTWNGGGIQRRLSYVEHSYQQLTNNVYSEGAIAGLLPDDKLDQW